MIEIGTRYGPLSYRMAFWPDEEELRRLADQIGAFDLTRVVQTEAGLETHRNLMRRNVFHTQVIDLTQGTDAILGNMRKTCRYEIRRVGREPDRVKVDRNRPEVLRDFLALYNDFVKRDRTLSTRIKNSGPTKRAVAQTKTARTQVKAAATSVTKAVRADANATKSAAKTVAS